MWNVMYNVIISIVTISMLVSSIFADDAPICRLFASPMCDGWRLTEEAMSVMVCPAQASLLAFFVKYNNMQLCNTMSYNMDMWYICIYLYMYIYTLWHGSRIHPRSSSRCSVSSFVVCPPFVPGLGSAFYFASLLGVPEAMDRSSDWSLPEYPAW